MKKQITKFLILTIILTATLSVNYLFAAWTGPTQAPPGGNTPTPIHVGSTDQVKDGALSLGALAVFGKGYFQGSVQVGNSGSNPQAGEIRWTGTDFEGYDGTQWVSLVGGAAAAPAADPNYTDCVNSGGSWIDAQGVCYFSGSNCPSGWTANESYSSTQAIPCPDYEYTLFWRQDRKCSNHPSIGSSNAMAQASCTTGSHSRANTAIETCTQYRTNWNKDYYYGGNCEIQWNVSRTCSATQTEVGCTKN